MNSCKILSNSNLKLIAATTMFIDHTGYCLIPYSRQWYPYYQLFRDIGRIAFPIYCFLLIEGFQYTKSRRKYATNLLLFAMISELPFDLAFNQKRSIWHSQNIFFTLFLGLLVIWGIEYFRGKVWAQTLILAAVMIISCKLNTDYNWRGVLLITLLYLFRQDAACMTIAGATCLLWEWKAIFAFLPINLYNGKRGWIQGKWAKYLFYWYYPAHLLLLCWLRYRLFAISPTFL